MIKYDSALVLGSGIKPNGELVESSKACVRKAVSLLLNREVSHIIFSGKWSWSMDYTPPITEAEAMSEYALELGAPKNKIITEKSSTTTVSNLCNVKRRILRKNKWKSVILISNHPYEKRAKYNLDKILGPDYSTKVITTDFNYPERLRKKLEEAETKKQQDAINFYKSIRDGDDKIILKLAMQDLENNYINQNKKS